MVGRAIALTHSRSGSGRFAPRTTTIAAIASTTPHLRPATLEDLPAIVEIYNATIPGRTATAQLEPVTVEERRPWFEASTPDRRPLWVAEQDGEVVGWVGLSDFHERAAYAATAQVSIYLREDQRGQGLGGRMLEFAMEGSRAIGVTHLIGLVFAHNTASLRLFERHGFERWGFMPEIADMDGVLRDLVHVGRRL